MLTEITDRRSQSTLATASTFCGSMSKTNEKVLPIGKDLVPTYNKMILAGLHMAELDE
jgi:hypothetical protein